jgi:hypothetical protein
LSANTCELHKMGKRKQQNKNTPSKPTVTQPKSDIKQEDVLSKEILELVKDVTSPLVQIVLKGYLEQQTQDDYVSEETSMSISKIASILPNVSLQRIAKVLKFTNQNEELSVDILLNEKDPQVRKLISPHLESLEQQYIQQVSLLDTLIEERNMIGDVEEGENDNTYNKFTLEKRLIDKRLREEKMARSTTFYCEGEIEALKQGAFTRYMLKQTDEFDCNAEEVSFVLSLLKFRFIIELQNHSSLELLIYLPHTQVHK